jgi:FMN-dependent NADH-azoreductase
MKLLHVDSSILGQGSVSRDLSADVVATFLGHHPDLAVARLDLAVTPIGHLTAAHLAAAQGAPVDDALRSDVAAGQFALEEFLAADIVVIGAPMYNFTIPTQLKTWIDRVVVPGQTFKYGPEGLVGLASAKRVILALARGNVYQPGSPAAPLEHAESYLRAILGFIGVSAPETVIAEGLALGDEQRTRAVARSLEEAALIA